LNFSSNDYLGLANHPLLKQAGIQAVEEFGAGSGAARLVCGSLGPHHELEEALAAYKGTEAALSFSSGYATAIGTICALLGKDDVIVLDKLVHACIVDAARLSGANPRLRPQRPGRSGRQTEVGKSDGRATRAPGFHDNHFRGSYHSPFRNQTAGADCDGKYILNGRRCSAVARAG
jgi:cystathionine beta-lyase/cystathionine gamma-synthase